MKPLLSNKIVTNEKITIVEGEEIIKSDQANEKVLINFFSNIVKNLEIPRYNHIDPICWNMRRTLLFFGYPVIKKF